MHSSFSIDPAFIDGIGGPEVMLVMFIALILFGGKSLPSFARTVGKSLREFKKATSEVEREIRRAIDEAPEQTPAPPSPGQPAAPVALGAMSVPAVPASTGLQPSPQAGAVPEDSPYPELTSLQEKPVGSPAAPPSVSSVQAGAPVQSAPASDAQGHAGPAPSATPTGDGPAPLTGAEEKKP